MADYQLFTTTDPGELWTRIDASAARFAALAREVPADLPLRGSSWSARDAVGHVLTVIRRYTQGPTLGETPRDVDRINADELAALGARSRDELLEELTSELKLAREMWAPETIDLHMRLPFHGGATIDGAAAMSNLIGEFLIHGRDIARSGGRPWSLGEREAVLILNGVLQILPAYARRDAMRSMRVRLSVRGGLPWLLEFDRGALLSKPSPAGRPPVDVVVRAPAEVLTLTLYSRLSPAAAVRAGMFVTGGRRPWRIAWLSSLLEQP